MSFLGSSLAIVNDKLKMISCSKKIFLSMFIIFSLCRLNSSFTFQRHVICDRAMYRNKIVNNIKLQLSNLNLDQSNNQSIQSLSSHNDTPVSSLSTSPQSSTIDSKHDIITLSTSSISVEEEGYYISCGSCKSVYLFRNAKDAQSNIGSRGTRVKCSVCDKQWFQGMDKVTKIDNQISFLPISTERAEEMKKFIVDNNWARNPRGEKIDLFIGNLPFNFDENDLTDLFAEYGVVGVALVRDADKQSKGFAFIEVIIVVIVSVNYISLFSH